MFENQTLSGTFEAARARKGKNTLEIKSCFVPLIKKTFHKVLPNINSDSLEQLIGFTTDIARESLQHCQRLAVSSDNYIDNQKQKVSFILHRIVFYLLWERDYEGLIF